MSQTMVDDEARVEMEIVNCLKCLNLTWKSAIVAASA
jgi:hypothetical protein